MKSGGKRENVSRRCYRKQSAGLDPLWLQKKVERENIAIAFDLKFKCEFFFTPGTNLSKIQTYKTVGYNAPKSLVEITH